MAKAKRIFFILPSLTGGGSERVVLTLLRNIDRTLFTPTLVLLDCQGAYLKELPDDIELIDLSVKRARYGIFKIYGLLKRERPDIVFSTLGHLNLLMGMLRLFFGKKIKFVSRESNTVSISNQQEPYPALFDFLYRRFYNNFDLIITQANTMQEDLIQNYQIDPKKIVMIHNPVDFHAIAHRLKEERFLLNHGGEIKLLAAGRLNWQKGFDILIETLYLLDQRYVLYIMGEGKEYEKLLKQRDALSLQERVIFLGFCDNPYLAMRDADLFVLSSRYEGLPNVVLEAHACGLPTVAFKTPGGTQELIIDSFNGFLVEEFLPRALAKKIQEASQFAFEKEAIKAYCFEHFRTERIVKAYEDALLEICNG